jgi:glycosyltransferase involved in cell wall biosynthesis
MGEVSEEATAQALNNLYYDPQRRQHLAQAAFEAAQNPDYSWEAVAERFDRLLGELTR